MENVIYFMKENKHCIRNFYMLYGGACICVHARLLRTLTEGHVELKIQRPGQFEYERGMGMFILLCRAQKERMCNHTHKHPGTYSLKSQWNDT